MKAILSMLLLCIPMLVHGQDANISADDRRKVITELGDDYQNSIPILQNRFRIDFKVEEVTMVFFREFGSAPVVLVKPDGSKLFQSRKNPEVVQWTYSSTWDVIKIRKPVPGPWQAMGQILPGSRIMILSEVALNVAPLPTVLFAGEILKQTGYLTNAGKPIEMREFREVVDLSVEFASANNPNFDNFGVDNELVARFTDNGRGMDEYPNDGVFTGQYNLSIKPGEWVPVYKVVTPLYAREQRGPKVRLYPNPIKLDVKLADTEKDEKYHQLTIDAVRNLIDISSLLVDGKIKYPNGESQNFSITKTSDDARQYAIPAFDYGVFRIKLTAFGNTPDGRNFILDVPEYSFLVESPQLPVPEPVVVPPGQTEVMDTPPPPPPEETDNTLTVIIIGAVNLVILLVIGVLGFLIWRKRKKERLAAQEGASAGNSDGEEELKELKLPAD